MPPDPLSGATIHTRLIALVLAVAVPLLGFASFLIYSNAAQSRRVAEFSALAIARDLAGATHEFLHVSANVMPQLANRMPFTPEGHIQCDPLLAQFHAVLPRIANIAAVDRDGRLACSARPFPPGGYGPVNHEPWFVETVRERRSVLSAPRRGRISGRWISSYTYPIVDATGKIGGVMALAIGLVDFEPVVRARGNSPGTVTGIIDESGTIVARSIDAEKWIGKKAGAGILGVLVPGADSGQIQSSGLDGVERFHALVRIAGTTWIAYAGIPAGPLGEQERQSRMVLYAVTIAIVLVAGVLALTLGLRITRPMRAMADAARALASGMTERRAPVVGPREIREVACEFNRMVEVRQRAESDLRELADRLRAVSQRLIEVEETERRAINRELHDRIGQNLAVLNLDLQIVRSQLPTSTSPEVRSRLADARTMVERTVVQVRDVMSDLRPAALDEYGLHAALGTYIDAYTARTGVAVSYSGEQLAPRLPLVMETALMRIAQGALVNAAKHAHATHVDVILDSTERHVLLSISDDGVGFTPEACVKNQGWGLRTMRERADAIGATLNIESAPGHGTRVTVEATRQPV
jgi:signal transduction histidine kinase